MRRTDEKRAFLLRLAEERLLASPEARTAGRCVFCGRDIYRWEIECCRVDGNPPVCSDFQDQIEAEELPDEEAYEENGTPE